MHYLTKQSFLFPKNDFKINNNCAVYYELFFYLKSKPSSFILKFLTDWEISKVETNAKLIEAVDRPWTLCILYFYVY